MAKSGFTIHAVGDVGPRREDPEYPFKQPIFELSAPVTRGADITFCQLERILSARADPIYCHNVVHPDNARHLPYGGFNVVSVAGNHHMDAGVEAFIDTLDILKKQKIQIVGGGMNITEARTPVIVERTNIRVAFLGYSSVLPKGEIPYDAELDRPGCAPVYVSTFYEASDWQPGAPSPKVISIADQHDLEEMKEDIRKAKQQADVVVMSIHWGVHHVPGLIAMYQYEVGHAAIDAGCDLIIGSHPHILKGIEVYKGKVIFYSLGNFAMDSPVKRSNAGRSDDTPLRPKRDPKNLPYGYQPDARKTIMVKCLIEDKTIKKVAFRPFLINQLGQPEPLSAEDKRSDDVKDYLVWCCEDQKLATRFMRDGNDVIICTSV